MPGCSIPAGWCEVHHVTPHRHGGRTHVDNGVLLCWGHHQKIDSGPWRISMPNGIPHVRGPAHHEWTHVTKARANHRSELPADRSHGLTAAGGRGRGMTELSAAGAMG
ncbi:HNH endonuclease signature motif containing protein [Labedella phragmitis]|uniref:HNH endonuclease n=1 Tax=Labedella phragmitis TaxID=2498849 RepID=UPI0031334641